MKKVFLYVLVLLITFGLTTESFALLKNSADTYRGTVVSVDSVRGELVVSDGGTTRTYSVTPAQASSVQRGQQVLVVVKRGSKVANLVQAIKVRKRR